MFNRNRRSGSRKTHGFFRALRSELLENRNLMAGDIVDTPTDPNFDISTGAAEVRGALDFQGDIDNFLIDVAKYDSFSAGAWKADGESLKFRVLDAAGLDVTDAVADSSGFISLIGAAQGKYTLQVSSESNETADYVVRVLAWTNGVWTPPEVTPRPDDVDEIGPDATFLDTSMGYAWTDGELVGSSDKDVFHFEFSDSGPIVIAGSPYRVDTAGFQIALLDAGGVPYGQGYQADLIEAELAAGKYYLVVSDAKGESVGYSLFLSTHIADSISSVRGGQESVSSPSNGSEDEFPEVGIAEEVAFVDSETDVKEADNSVQDMGFDINIYIRDGVYYYGHEFYLPVGDLPVSAPGDELVPTDEVERGKDVGDVELILGGFDPSDDLCIFPVPEENLMHNASRPLDVNVDGFVSPADALLIINVLNSGEEPSANSPSPAAASFESRKVDTNNSGSVTPADALLIINQLNSRTFVSEGESSGYAAQADQYFADLNMEEGHIGRRRVRR